MAATRPRRDPFMNSRRLSVPWTVPCFSVAKLLGGLTAAFFGGYTKDIPLAYLAASDLPFPFSNFYSRISQTATVLSNIPLPYLQFPFLLLHSNTREIWAKKKLYMIDFLWSFSCG